MENSQKWSLSAKYGLLLSIISIVATLLALIVPESSPWLGTLITIIKISAVNYLLLFFMKKYASLSEELVSYGDSFKFGFRVCFLSSIVVSLFTWFVYSFIAVEQMDLVIETILATFNESGVGGLVPDYDTLKAMVPKYMAIGIFIDCMIFGLIFPAILANYAQKRVFPEGEDLSKEDL